MDNLKMQNAKRLLKAAILVFIGFIVLWLGGRTLLTILELRLRQWVISAELVIMALLALFIVVAAIYTLCIVFKAPQEDKQKRTQRRFLSVLGITAVVAFVGVIGFAIWVISAFADKAEHVVEKHGQKMVANVTGIGFDYEVDYYEHKNFIVNGGKPVGYEYYRDLGGDPFESSATKEPDSYWFTDFDGNMIVTSKGQ